MHTATLPAVSISYIGRPVLSGKAHRYKIGDSNVLIKTVVHTCLSEKNETR